MKPMSEKAVPEAPESSRRGFLLGAASAAGFGLSAASGFAAAAEDSGREAVILLHGMGRSPLSMRWLAGQLRRTDFETHIFGYSARRESPAAITERLHAFIAERATGRDHHLVGHSLGSILIRNGFKQGYAPGLKRIVMLAPPNQPADLAERLGGLKLFRSFTGECGQCLGDSLFYNELPTPSVPFGVIAGSAGQRLTFDEPNDGIVTVAKTRLPGMADWAVIDRTHTFMMFGRDTAELTINFLKKGRFRG